MSSVPSFRHCSSQVTVAARSTSEFLTIVDTDVPARDARLWSVGVSARVLQASLSPSGFASRISCCTPERPRGNALLENPSADRTMGTCGTVCHRSVSASRRNLLIPRLVGHVRADPALRDRDRPRVVDGVSESICPVRLRLEQRDISDGLMRLAEVPGLLRTALSQLAATRLERRRNSKSSIR